ncbi:MAG: hypothetical protein U9N13_08480 [Euryarchaeota archaeon]|nr:hypothetical protein [Euryarchaeota archaeon]
MGGTIIPHWYIVENIMDELRSVKGIEKTMHLDEMDLQTIMELEEKDRMNEPRFFGEKNNVGVKKAFISDITMSFVTNKEFDWPRDIIQIVHMGQVVGKDINDPVELEEYKKRRDCCVMGNIVVHYDKFLKINSASEPPTMVINAKPFPVVENIPQVCEAIIASPSRSTDGYIKSKMDVENKSHMGTFLVGIQLEDPLPEI